MQHGRAQPEMPQQGEWDEIEEWLRSECRANFWLFSPSEWSKNERHVATFQVERFMDRVDPNSLDLSELAAILDLQEYLWSWLHALDPERVEEPSIQRGGEVDPYRREERSAHGQTDDVLRDVLAAAFDPQGQYDPGGDVRVPYAYEVTLRRLGAHEDAYTVRWTRDEWKSLTAFNSAAALKFMPLMLDIAATEGRAPSEDFFKSAIQEAAIEHKTRSQREIEDMLNWSEREGLIDSRVDETGRRVYWAKGDRQSDAES